MNNYLALKTFTNDAIFEEVVHRIKRMHIEQFGKELQFGEVAFVFHDGKFKAIEDRSKLHLYKNTKDTFRAEPVARGIPERLSASGI